VRAARGGVTVEGLGSPTGGMRLRHWTRLSANRARTPGSTFLSFSLQPAEALVRRI